jgi:hypothetical protein
MSTVYPNQQAASDKITEAFEKNSKLAMMMVVGLAQGGKTGAMLATSMNFMKHKKMGIPPENIYLITGFSSVDWEVQTRDRLPEKLRPNVFHRNKLGRGFKNSVKGKSNVLILIDEVQIAAGVEHTLSKVFEQLGYLDVDFLLKNKIKVVQFSATPNGTLYDGMDTLNEHYAITKLEASEGYHGVRHFYDNGRLKPFNPLSGSQYDPESLKELKQTIEESYSSPRYHMIRTPTGLGQYEVIVNMFGDRDADGKRKDDGIFDEEKYATIMYDMDNHSKTHKIRGEDVSEIDYILKTKPVKHTFILLKEKARCSKTFPKTHIGVWYERYTENPMDDVIVQGLLGRAGGYDDPGDSIIFTSIQSAEDYLALWDSDFDKSCDWTSRTTKIVEEEVVSKGTWVSLVKVSEKSESGLGLAQ